MSAATDLKRSPDENKLVMALLRRKIITDGQLKAAMDYQRSLGGQISEILVKLGLARASQVDEVLKNPDSDGPGENAGAESALDPDGLRLADLKVHRKLLEKIPADLQDRHLFVPFFPLPSGDSRRIIMGHGRPVTAEAVAKVKSILGVDLYTLALEERVARDFVAADPKSEAARRSHPGPPRPEPPRSEPPKVEPAKAESPRAESPAPEPPSTETVKVDPVSTDHMVGVLMTLLVRKGILSREELEAELLVTASQRARG